MAEWVRITGERQGLVAQVAPTALPDGRPAGPQHKPRGTREAARKLGMSRDQVARSLKINELSDAAKAEASATRSLIMAAGPRAR